MWRAHEWETRKSDRHSPFRILCSFDNLPPLKSLIQGLDTLETDFWEILVDDRLIVSFLNVTGAKFLKLVSFQM